MKSLGSIFNTPCIVSCTCSTFRILTIIQYMLQYLKSLKISLYRSLKLITLHDRMESFQVKITYYTHRRSQNKFKIAVRVKDVSSFFYVILALMQCLIIITKIPSLISSENHLKNHYVLFRSMKFSLYTHNFKF